MQNEFCDGPIQANSRACLAPKASSGRSTHRTCYFFLLLSITTPTRRAFGWAPILAILTRTQGA